MLSKIAGSVKQISSIAPQLGKGIDKLTIIKTFKPTATSANVLSGKLASLGTSAQFAGVSIRKFNNIIRENSIQFVKGIGFMDKFTGKVMDTSRVTRMASIQAKRFRFEWLSVMFAGMALSRVFGGLIRTQLELFGVTGVLSAAWTLVLLPIMELITPILFKMLDLFMNMPQGMKLAVGAFVLLAGALGVILTVIGQLMLAYGGFSILIMSNFGSFGAAVAAFGAIFSATFLAIAAIVAVVILGMFFAWKQNFLGMKRIVDVFFRGFKILVAGMVAPFIGMFNILKGIFTGNFDLFLKGIKQFMFGWIKVIKGAAMIIASLVLGILVGAIKVIHKFITGALDLLIEGYNRTIAKITGKKIRFSFQDLPVPSFQTGGIVKDTGLALVHKGEEVIPRSKVNGRNESTVIFNNIFNIENNTGSDVDVDRLAEEINRKFAPQFERAVGKGTI